jgi:uncharacterized membrane protein (DUF2068 family)
MSSSSPPPARSEPVSRAGLRTVAILEGMKGLVVLGAGLGLLSLIHRDVQGLADKVVQHFHLNPASRYPHIFLEAATKVTDTGLWLLAMTALLYALARFVEAYGLWYRRRWAQWFAIVTSALYLPIESYELHGEQGKTVCMDILKRWRKRFYATALTHCRSASSVFFTMLPSACTSAAMPIRRLMPT